MGYVVPTMPPPPRPRRPVACCDYCLREISPFSAVCAGCGAPHRTLVIGGLSDEIDATCLEDSRPRSIFAFSNPIAQPAPDPR